MKNVAATSGQSVSLARLFFALGRLPGWSRVGSETELKRDPFFVLRRLLSCRGRPSVFCYSLLSLRAVRAARAAVSRMITSLLRLAFAQILSLFGFAVPTRAGAVVKAGCGVDPDLDLLLSMMKNGRWLDR